MTTFAVVYTYGGEPAVRDEHRPAHKDFLETLYTTGVLRVSGPFGPDEAAGALLVIEGESKHAVEQVMDGDPFATLGLIARREIRQWNIFFGAIAA